MENKKGSLSTVFLVIAIILILVMGVFLYMQNMQKVEMDRQIAILENSRSEMQETINDLQGKIESISNTINDAETNKEDNNQEKDNKQEIINILKNANNSKEYFNVIRINYENEKYNIEVEYNTPVVISESEFNNLKKNKKITLNNEIYEYVTASDSANGYIQKNNQKYEIVNYNNGYAFELSGTAGGYTWTINKTENMKFVADEDTVIYDSFVGQEYKLEDNKAKDWLNKSLENTTVRLRYSDDLGLSLFIDNK